MGLTGEPPSGGVNEMLGIGFGLAIIMMSSTPCSLANTSGSANTASAVLLPHVRGTKRLATLSHLQSVAARRVAFMREGIERKRHLRAADKSLLLLRMGAGGSLR